MDYCKKCKNFGCNAAGTERTTTDCEDYMSHLPTNADRIRAMTDEELEVWLVNLCCATVGDAANARVQILRGNLLGWLKQEAKE